MRDWRQHPFALATIVDAPRACGAGARQELPTWTYSEAVHFRTTIEQLASGFHEVLRQLIEECGRAANGIRISQILLAPR